MDPEAQPDRYRDLFELAPYAYLVTDYDGAIHEANRAAAALFGAEQRDLLGTPFAELVPAVDREELRRRFGELRASDVPITFDLDVEPRGSRPVSVEVRAVAVAEADPRLAVRWLLVDVTARKRAEYEARDLTAELEQRADEHAAELATERARLRTIVESAPVGIALREAPSGRLLFANAQAEVIFGPLGDAPMGDLPGVHGFRLDGSEYGRDDWPFARALDRGERVIGEQFEVERADGTRRLVEASCAPVRDADGRITSAVAILVDVTDRHARERAEREFVTNAAHELRTPLAAITSAVEVLQAGAKEIPDDRDLFLGHVQRETDRLHRLTRALLALARAQTRVERPAAEIVDVRELLEAVAATLAPAAGVEVQVDCDPGVAVVTNRDLLEQALSNLAQNAVAHTREGRIGLAAELDGDRVVLVVSDTGVGIMPDDQLRVFDRFYRAGDRDRGGFGLGLTIATHAAEALGSELDLESVPGTGTTVRMAFPGATLVTA